MSLSVSLLSVVFSLVDRRFSPHTDDEEGRMSTKEEEEEEAKAEAKAAAKAHEVLQQKTLFLVFQIGSIDQ